MNLHIEQRTLAQSGLDSVARIGPAPEDRVIAAPHSSGSYKVYGIRPDLNLTVFDVMVGNEMGSPVASKPCLAIDILFEAAGSGNLLPPDGSPTIPIPYRSGAMYLFFTDGGATGRYDVPFGTRFSGIDIRVGLDLLERLGALALFERLDQSHPLHTMSCKGCWIAMLPTPSQLLLQARAIRDGEARGGEDLSLEARCLDLLQSAIELVRSPPPTQVTAGRDHRRIEMIHGLMLADLARPWTISELARRAGLGEKRLKAGFRETYGKPLYRYLQQARLVEARRLLEHEDISVTEVSLAVGYTSVSHFAGLFAREFGMLPSAARLRPQAGTMTPSPR